MIDPTTSLAFSMHSRPGVYALLLGSGISRPAEIPTGWEVTLDLIGKVAEAEGAEVEGSPETWFKEEFGEEPDYSTLLESLSPTPAERQQLLRGYFEPTPEEREEGVKTPTKAHAAMARLVAGGYIRVIVTTNFDRLLEQALEAEGVSPTVISTPDAIKGAVPLTHSDCTIVKVHGDYLDTRLRNTPEELAEYPEEINALLDRVFDEFGLIVVGWSGRWDPALRSALERCSSHRYTTYWTSLSEPDEVAEKLIQLRRAEQIQIEGADSFSQRLEEKVRSLEEYGASHPLSAALAVATAKRYLAEDRHRIRLSDLVVEETERVVSVITSDRFDLNERPVDGEAILARVRAYESASEVLRSLMATGCYWGTHVHRGFWVDALSRVSSAPQAGAGSKVWLDLASYPGALLYYAGGIAALRNRQWETLKSLMIDAVVRDWRGEERPAVTRISSGRLLDKKDAQELPEMERRHTPMSDWLFSSLRGTFEDLIPDDEIFERHFNWLEYLTGLVFADLTQREWKGGLWGPVGRFGWKWQGPRGGGMPDQVKAEMEGDAARAMVDAGLFNGDPERMKESKARYATFWQSLQWF